MAMGKLTTQEEGQLLKFISDLGITPQDALIFLSRHEIDMGEHQDLRSSLDELHKVHASLSGQSQGNGFNLIKCKAAQHAGTCGGQAASVGPALPEH